MSSRTSVPAPHAMTVTSRESAQSNVVLDRVVARVRQRQAVEQAATNRVGDGAHAASLIWPWPF